jgi:hypothetical protein
LAERVEQLEAAGQLGAESLLGLRNQLWDGEVELVSRAVQPAGHEDIQLVQSLMGRRWDSWRG